MLTNSFLALNWQATAMSKLAVSFRKSNIDVTALLKKNGSLGADAPTSTENSKADIIEISDIQKKTHTSVLRPDIEELVNYVREQAERRKPPKNEEVEYTPPSAETIKLLKAEREELERSKANEGKGNKIISKIKSGQRLTKEELDFIKETDPELYMDYIRIEREREQFRNQLANCKTKEARTLLITIKKNMIAQEAKITLKAYKNKKEPVLELSLMSMIDVEVAEDDKRNGFVKKADKEAAREINGNAAVGNHAGPDGEEVEMRVADDNKKKQGAKRNSVAIGTQARQATNAGEIFKTDSFNSVV